MKVEGDIDPVKYGVLWQKVEGMDSKLNKLEDQMDELIGLANKSKGGMWAGMAIVSFMGGVAGFFSHWFMGK